jgi:serine/threonine-protein phosphatase 5
MDADSAIKISPTFAKAYYRRAAAYCALNRWKNAVEDFRKTCQLIPKDLDAKQKYEWSVKEKKYRDLGRSLDDGSSAKKITEDSVVVESAYTGPVLNDLKDLTQEWVINLINYLKDEKRLHKKYVIKLINSLAAFYRKLYPIVEITVPEGEHITVCGDVHGQFYDLLNIFKIGGLPSPTNIYLFDGDFVDRGSFSVEVIITLMAWNLLYPGSFHLNRGNHEAAQMNMLYG